MNEDITFAAEVKMAVVKVLSTWACVVAGWKLSDVTALMGFFSVTLATLYTVLNLYVLWRDKLRSKRDGQDPPDQAASPR